MGANTLEIGGFVEAMAAMARQRPGPAWLQPLRLDALRRLESAGLPATTQEDWRYTDLREFAERSRRLAQGPQDEATGPGKATAIVEPSGMGLVALFDGGALLGPRSRLAPPPGVSASLLGAAGAQGHWQESLAASAAADADGVDALNAALLGDGLALEITAGTTVAAPLYVACASRPDRAAHNRIVLRLRAGSSCTLIEHHVGAGPGVSNSVTDIICERGAHLTYVRLQNDADEAFHLASQRITLAAGAQASLLGLDLGAQLARNTLRVTLAEADAAADIHGLFFADGRRHVDNQTRVDHRARRTRCREKYRGIVDGHGRGVFNGKIIVHAGADQADAQLRNENLLLSRDAEVDTKPELEIYADDVKCAHGATTGQLDPTAIFYLRSRGIDAGEARRILVAAFAREMINRLPVAALEAHVLAMLGPRLPDLAAVGRE